MKSGTVARSYRRNLLLSTALVALVCTTGLPAGAQSVTGSGDLNPGPAQSPNWAVGGDLLVGDAANGQLDITAGGTVTNDLGTIGYGVGSNGTVTVSGADGSGNASTWANTNDLVVGQSGAGSLTILNGGKVTSQTGYIAADLGSQGTVTVSGVDSNGNASTWTNAGDLNLGYGGAGTLSILAGGQVSNVNGYVSGGGNALVSGQGSSWQNSGRLAVGVYGAGTLRVEGGAAVSSADGLVGSGARGDVVLTGAGTTWTNASQLTVGSYSTGTLRIEDRRDRQQQSGLHRRQQHRQRYRDRSGLEMVDVALEPHHRQLRDRLADRRE